MKINLPLTNIFAIIRVIFNVQDTLYVGDIEEREDAGTPPIIQKVRAALSFWLKEYVGYKAIEKQEHQYIRTALERLAPNPNIQILGNVGIPRQAILSFIVYTTSDDDSTAEIIDDSTSADGEWGQLCKWRETGRKRDKPMSGTFVARLLNDLFGIQARGGCACAGPYGHTLLHVEEPLSLAIRSTIHEVKPQYTFYQYSKSIC